MLLLILLEFESSGSETWVTRQCTHMRPGLNSHVEASQNMGRPETCDTKTHEKSTTKFENPRDPAVLTVRVSGTCPCVHQESLRWLPLHPTHPKPPEAASKAVKEQFDLSATIRGSVRSGRPVSANLQPSFVEPIPRI